MYRRFLLLISLLALLLLAGCRSSQPQTASFADAIAGIPGVRLGLDADCPDDFRPGGVGDVYRAHWDGSDIWLCASEETLRASDSGEDLTPWMQSAQALHFHVAGRDIWFVPAQANDRRIDSLDENKRIVTTVAPGVDLLGFVLEHHLQPWLDARQLAELWKKQGDKQRSERHFRDAIESYEQAVSLNPEFADAYIGLGAAQLGLGDAEAALDSLWRAATLAPDNYWAQRLLGNAYLNLRRYKLAVAPLTRAYTLNPDEPQVLIGVALALGRSGQPDRALRVLDAAAQRIDDPKLLGDIQALREEFSRRGD